MKVLRFYAPDWLRNQINRRVRRARHQGRVTTTASDVIRELLYRAIAADGARRARRRLKPKARRQAKALQELRAPYTTLAKAGPNNGQEKESD